MIAQSLKVKTNDLQREFREATPFPHFCIDNFLQEDFAVLLLRDLRIPSRIPLMYGGGTHENINGAELVPHIDFNFDSNTNNH